MAFNPEHLPTTVYEIYKMGPLMWMVTVQSAIQVGIRNPDTLTNIVFYVHHPELEGRPLRKDETKLIADYKVFRTMVKAMLPEMIKTHEAPKFPVSNNVRANYGNSSGHASIWIKLNNDIKGEYS